VAGNAQLWLDFANSGPNQGEGVVRVGSYVYAENEGGINGQDGVTCLSDNSSVLCSAELQVLVELAEYQPEIGLDYFQYYVTADKGGEATPVDPPKYVALPLISYLP
jgi:hypothetical protein